MIMSESRGVTSALRRSRPKLGVIYRVRLDAADINVEGKRVAIAPGMAVNAEIITGDRRVIEYVLSPILRYRHESGRER
jgi:hemolysin D